MLISLVWALASISWASGFGVNTVAELRPVLTTAAGNGENGTINIATETYNTSETLFSYAGAAVLRENYSPTLTGAGVGSTILDGEGSS